MLEPTDKRKLNLYTTNEISELLKLNIQVVTRKLKTGEIEGYKLGKDWRVSEEQLINYLERHSNKKNKMSEKEKVVSAFIVNNKLKTIPSSLKKRIYILEYLVSKLDPNKVYEEEELNNILKEYNEDFCTLRREFIANKLMIRKDGKYKRTSI